MSGIAFNNVGALKPGRTRFDWHFEKKFDTDFGVLVPILSKLTMPGDYWNIDVDVLVRCLPLIAPIMHEVTIDTHYFFVPNRLIDDTNANPGCGNPLADPLSTMTQADKDAVLQAQGGKPFNWELYITGGFDGMDVQEYPKAFPNANYVRSNDPTSYLGPNGGFKTAPYENSIWDYLDFPTRPTPTPNQIESTGPNGTLIVPNPWNGVIPLSAKFCCYHLIYNEYYRDETLQNPVEWFSFGNLAPNRRIYSTPVLLRNWRKDYFTSALPFQQRGVAPAFPISGNLSASFNMPSVSGGAGSPGNTWNLTNAGIPIIGTAPQPTLAANIQQFLNANTINITDAVTFDVADMRFAFQLQKWLERNARAGARYISNLYAHFGVSPTDERLNRPEYIGGTKSPLIISEVLQTSETNTSPQGTMAGHGINMSRGNVGTYNVKEWGYIMGLLSIMPKPTYQQGFPREDLYDSRYEYPWPEFANLSEQAIKTAEIYCNGLQGVDIDNELFGYQGNQDEFRTMNSSVNGAMKSSLNYWHMGRVFQTKPNLNNAFIQCNPMQFRRCFAIQNTPPLLCDVIHNITAVRPIPAIAEPGLIDHH